ncbi:hypothetical protein [Vibrio cholerae]|uniref:hypothetical protein n=1 Tax=Vibrio cholerae TaxID=666 RepID=UPI002AB5A687|nr:hypothetical protein [Vibrio cholerae]MDY7588551.1 hypothetical protein [Vibrio cholerae]
MNIEIVSHLQSWVNSIGSSHKNSFDVLSIKQMKIENLIKEMLSITDVSAYYERYKEDAYRSFCLAVHTYIKSAQDLDNKSKKKAFYHIHHFYVEDDVAPNVWRGKLRGRINVVANIEKSSRFRTQAKFRTSVEAVSDIDSDD